MLSDPLQFEDGMSSLTLPRVSGTKPGARKLLGQTTYRTAGGGHALYVRRDLNADDTTRIEVILERKHLDNSPFDGDLPSLVNRVGFVMEINDFLYEVDPDINELRSLLDAFLTPETVSRLIGGES